MKVHLLRDEIETTTLDDTNNTYRLGKLRARIWFIPVPVRFAKWLMGVK